MTKLAVVCCLLAIVAACSAAREVCPRAPTAIRTARGGADNAGNVVVWTAASDEAFVVTSAFEINPEWYEVMAVNGSRAGTSGWIEADAVLPCEMPDNSKLTYSRNNAVNYALQWWNGANHGCSSAYDSCSPWSYWGWESCGLASHGGDCANFVSQSLIAGGHPALNQGAPCRGYPCGKEEIGAKNLGSCLGDVHGWKRTCSKYQTPPSNIAIGDVIVYHKSSCTDSEAHATIVTGVSRTNGTASVSISCHSTDRKNANYDTFHTEFAFYEWLHYPS